MTSSITTERHMTPEEIAQAAEDVRRFPPGHPVHLAVGRTLSNIYSFWCLCDRTGCRRAGHCVSDPHHCLGTCLPLISDAVYEGGQHVLEAKVDGLSFDALIARWPSELRDLWVWNGTIENRRGVPRMRVQEDTRDDTQ